MHLRNRGASRPRTRLVHELNIGVMDTTNCHYDAAGRMTSFDYPNGVTTTTTYDALNCVQNVNIASSLGAVTGALPTRAEDWKCTARCGRTSGATTTGMY